MTAGRPPEYENGTEVFGESLDIIEWLQHCLDVHEAGDTIDIDPFWIPRVPVTDERVEQMIAALDARFNVEIDSYPSFHERRSGADAHTDFNRLSPTNQRALAEGLERILEEYEDYNAALTAQALAGAKEVERPLEQGGPDYSGGS